MLFVGKLKEGFKDVVKEHKFSIVLFLIGTIVMAISYGGFYDSNATTRSQFKILMEDVCTCAYWIMFGLSAGALLCETIHQYLKQEKKSYNPKNSKSILLYSLLMVTSLIVTVQYLIVEIMDVIDFKKLPYTEGSYTEISDNFMLLFMAAYYGLSVFFFYKRSKDTFEKYASKAFCGLMKAELVYGIIAVGTLMILFAFDSLIYDLDKFDVIIRWQMILLGLVQYPCVLMGLRKSDKDISKFEKSVLAYVFTALLAIAFGIIYVYILKIVIRWTFPSNQVFSILTWLFVFGFAIWTMAQGCEEEKFVRAYRLMPLFFIPFIILQIMCLAMRVSEYGFTPSRYYGMALIIFEIIYFAIYIYKLRSNKDIMAYVVLVAIAGVFFMLICPGTNVSSTITRSQKAKIEKFLREGDSLPSDERAKAYEAYNEIYFDGGLVGEKYIDKNLSDEQIELMKKANAIDEKHTDYAKVERKVYHFDVTSYSDLRYVQCAYEIEDEDEENAENTVSKEPEYLDLSKLEVSDFEDGYTIGIVDLSKLAKLVISNEENDVDGDAKKAVLENKLPMSDFGFLQITYFKVRYDSDNSDNVEYLYFEGYVYQ
ncbi:DUF4153 domain-containing protein [Butyrivibrio sp. VCB2006]|uniref:DUF4153 domain-containing protein n=1 Tax=Butyrivibrio sp. VCB2006 TaxID=1280679 RepID=UPI00040182FA|nr:DUF4153 domain-containing protein [Butyrivibrio sp. VCB2006]